MPVEPVTLGFKFAIRVADLRASDYVLLTCRACRASHKVPPWMLHATAPETVTIKSLEGRMRCRACGARGNCGWSVWRARPPVGPV